MRELLALTGVATTNRSANKHPPATRVLVRERPGGGGVLVREGRYSDYKSANKNPQPQNSVPDVIIWMLCGKKRVAYHRIPSNQVMYSPKKNCAGKLCGVVFPITLKVLALWNCFKLSMTTSLPLIVLVFPLQ